MDEEKRNRVQGRRSHTGFIFSSEANVEVLFQRLFDLPHIEDDNLVLYRKGYSGTTGYKRIPSNFVAALEPTKISKQNRNKSRRR